MKQLNKYITFDHWENQGTSTSHIPCVHKAKLTVALQLYNDVIKFSGGVYGPGVYRDCINRQ